MRLFWIVAVVILVDQASKLAVVQHMHLRQSIPLIGDWFKLTFTENPGMAFGLNVGPDGFVAVLAVLATILVTWYLWRVRNSYWPYAASLALILGGALGNIIDRMFYGVIFDYGPLFQGRVVDFIHVDIGYVLFPEFIPVFGGSYLSLFPIWNVADMAIVGGVIGVLIFQGAFHRRITQKLEAAKAESIKEESKQEVPHQASHLGFEASSVDPERPITGDDDLEDSSQMGSVEGSNKTLSDSSQFEPADENTAPESKNVPRQ